jgi:hypothetical protein
MHIVANGHTLHLVIEDQSPEAIALVEAIFAADQAVRTEAVTSDKVAAAYDAIAAAEAAWCKAHGFRHDIALMMALARLSDNLHRAEARHATA